MGKIILLLLTLVLQALPCCAEPLVELQPLSAVPTFRTENREHVEKFVQHMAKFKEIVDSPLQSVHIDKRNTFSLQLMDALALCGAVSEFNVLHRQAFEAMQARGMTHQDAVKTLNEPEVKQQLTQMAERKEKLQVEIMDAEEHFEQAKAAAARQILQSEDVLDDGDRRSLEYQIILDQEAQAFQGIAWKSETNYHREIREIETMPTEFCGPDTPDALKQTALERHVDTMITLGRRYLPFGETFHNFLEGEFADAVRSGSVDLALTMIPLGKIASSIGRAVKPLAAPVVAAFEKQAIRYGAKVTDKLPGLFNNPDVMTRGMMYEDHVAKQITVPRLNPNHPTFDFFDRISRKAVSVKSLDTQTAARLADPTQVYKSIRQNINKARDYTGIRGDFLPNEISSRELRIGIPIETNTTQWTRILEAVRYGKNNGVQVIIEAIK